MIEETTADDLRNRAEEHAEPLDRLIRPNDVEETAEEWSDIGEETLREEISEAVDVILSEVSHHTHTPLRSVLYDRAITVHVDHLQRAPMRHLTFDTEREAIEAGYWPNGMTRTEALHTVAEVYPTLRDLPIDDYREAHCEASEGLHDGMTPRPLRSEDD